VTTVDQEWALRYCLGKPGAYLVHPWSAEHTVVKVGGKIFAFLGSATEPLVVTVKNTPEQVAEWRARFPAQIGPGPYLDKRLWNRVAVAGPGAPDEDDVRELLDDSYELIVAGLPRRKRP
jgi:predicted DNA-binding protein (MmcQ/YjbR family)